MATPVWINDSSSQFSFSTKIFSLFMVFVLMSNSFVSWANKTWKSLLFHLLCFICTKEPHFHIVSLACLISYHTPISCCLKCEFNFFPTRAALCTFLRFTEHEWTHIYFRDFKREGCEWCKKWLRSSTGHLNICHVHRWPSYWKFKNVQVSVYAIKQKPNIFTIKHRKVVAKSE